MDLKLPFGLKNSQLVHVSDVESGLKCDCSCPACGHPLVAKKGGKKTHHFAHDKSSQCSDAFETSIHLAAKKVIEEAGCIQLPKLECDIFAERKILLFDQRVVHFDKIYLEKKYHDIIPDILLEKNGRLLCVEIYVTHKVDEQKRKKIEESKLSTIEIDLSKIDRTIDFKSLKEMVVDSVTNKKWLFSLKRYNFHKKVLKNSISRQVIAHGVIGRHVDDCPITVKFWNGKPYADVRYDCEGCRYNVKPEENYRDDKEGNYHHDEHMVYCIGHKTEEEINNLLNNDHHGLIKDFDHIRNIEQSKGNPICPRCGKKMVLRTARKGPGVGSKFWGCSDFPSCNGLLSI